MRVNKIIKIGIFLFFVSLLCCSCDGDVTRDLRHAGFAIGSDFKCSPIFPKNKNDSNVFTVRYLSDTKMITTDGFIYEVSFDKIFANNENCKRADTSIQVSAIFDDDVVKGVDGRYYYLVGKNNVVSYSEVLPTDNSYNIYDLLLKDDDVVKVVTADSSNGIFYILKTDGNVYIYGVYSKDRNSLPVVVSSMVLFDYSDYGGSMITDFGYKGDNSLETYIRTRDHVFRMKVTNSDVCNKYSDVECEYNLQQDLVFDKHKDRIIVYNGAKIITDYKKVFTVSS